MKKKIFEGFEVGDLKNVIHPQITLDEFRSKLGTDDKNVVVTFLLDDKNAAIDLVDFLERGYEFVLDADVSTSEIKSGSYLVFLEIPRKNAIAEQIVQIIEDLKAASTYKLKDWKFRYMKTPVVHSLTVENIRQFVPLSPKKYRNLFQKPIEELKIASGMPIATKNNLTPEQRKIMHGAGIRHK